MNEKYIKEKLNLINNRLNKIEELKDNMNQNIKSSEFELILNLINFKFLYLQNSFFLLTNFI